LPIKLLLSVITVSGVNNYVHAEHSTFHGKDQKFYQQNSRFSGPDLSSNVYVFILLFLLCVVRVAEALLFRAVFSKSVLVSFFFWLSHCLHFSNLRIQIIIERGNANKTIRSKDETLTFLKRKYCYTT
jgi:hypothetical protein